MTILAPTKPKPISKVTVEPIDTTKTQSRDHLAALVADALRAGR